MPWALNTAQIMSADLPKLIYSYHWLQIHAFQLTRALAHSAWKSYTAFFNSNYKSANKNLRIWSIKEGTSFTLESLYLIFLTEFWSNAMNAKKKKKLPFRALSKKDIALQILCFFFKER